MSEIDDENRAKVLVRHSKIGGRGVFAAVPIKKGTILGPIRGTIVSESEVLLGEADADYTMDLREDLMLDPAEPYRYLNHSCEPNAELFGYYDDDADELWLEVIRYIRRGQEVTIDYQWPVEYAIPCQCGAKKCRQWIVLPEGLEELLQTESIDS